MKGNNIITMIMMIQEYKKFYLLMELSWQLQRRRKKRD